MSDYGICPMCANDVVSRERRLDGNDRCSKGCVYKSNRTIKLSDKHLETMRLNDLLRQLK